MAATGAYSESLRRPTADVLPDVIGLLEKHEYQLQQQQVCIEMLVSQSKKYNAGSTRSIEPSMSVGSARFTEPSTSAGSAKSVEPSMEYEPSIDAVYSRIKQLAAKVTWMERQMQEKADTPGSLDEEEKEQEELRRKEDLEESMREFVVGYLKEKFIPDDRPKTHQELSNDNLDHFSLGYRIEDTMWDSAVFAGFECLTMFDNLVIFLGLVLTICISFSFVLVVASNYHEMPFDKAQTEALLHWRAVVAHDVAHYDPASGTSLAARVCAEELSIDRSGFQMDLYQDINSFTRNNVEIPLSEMNGHYLCNLALILWFFTIIHDMTSNFRYMIAVCQQRIGSAELHSFGDGDIRIVSVKRLQIVWVFMLSVVPRFLISVILAYAGTYFLAFTYSVDELLLNAVAMVFVVDVDEMFFDVLLTANVKRLMRSVAPLRPQPKTRYPITNVMQKCGRWVSRLLLVGILLVISNIYIINPFHDHLEDAWIFLCGGNKDFLYTENRNSRVVMFSPTPKFDYQDAHEMTYRKRAVLELIGMSKDKYMDKVGDLPDADNYAGSAVALPFSQLVQTHRANTRSISQTMMCIDHTDKNALMENYHALAADQYFQATKLLFRDQLDMHDFQNCSQLKFDQDCMSAGNTNGRALCPGFCGCDDPWVGQFFATASSGCPVSCSIRWSLCANYRAPAIASWFTDLCEDIPAVVLKEQVFWQHYILGVRNYLLLYESLEYAEEVQENLLEHGCAFITELRFFVDICSPNDFFRSARLFCPSTCMCAGRFGRECPVSCRFDMPHMETSRGVLCPVGLEIRGIEECEYAALELLHKELRISEYRDDLPTGCYLWHGSLHHSKQNNNTNPIPANMTSLCKATQPILPNAMTKGRFSRAQSCANCFLNGSACAQDCLESLYDKSLATRIPTWPGGDQ